MGNGYGNEEVYQETVDFARDPDAGEHRSFSGIVGDTPLNINQIESAQDYLKNYFEPQAQAYNEYYDKMSSYVNNENSRRKSFFDLLTGSKDNSNPNTQVNPSFYKEAGWGIAPGGSMALLPTALPPPEYLPKTAPYHAIPSPQWNRVSVSGGKANLPTGGGPPKDKYYSPPIVMDNGTNEKHFDSKLNSFEAFANTDAQAVQQNVEATMGIIAKDGYVTHWTKQRNLSAPYTGYVKLVSNGKKYNAPQYGSNYNLYDGAKHTIQYVLTALRDYSKWKGTDPNKNIKEYVAKVDKSGIPNLEYYVDTYNGKETTLADWINFDKNDHIYLTTAEEVKKGLSKVAGHDILLGQNVYAPGVSSQYVKLKIANIVNNLYTANKKKIMQDYWDKPKHDFNLTMAKLKALDNDETMLTEQLALEMWRGKPPF